MPEATLELGAPHELMEANQVGDSSLDSVYGFGPSREMSRRRT